MSTAAEIIVWARARPPAAAGTRVIAFEGRSGAGKTVLARQVADGLGAALVRMDDIYPGWDGLLASVETLRDRVLAPLAAGQLATGQPVRWRRWDWAAERYGGWHEQPVGGLMVVEGVGCGARELSAYLSGLVWIEAPANLRRGRALNRDGAAYAPHWERWARQEEAFYAGNDVPAYADLIIDGTAGLE